VNSRLWATAILSASAHLSCFAGVVPQPRALSDFVVQKVLAVPSMTIRAMLQGSDGYLWLGSYGGLLRFDGVRIVTFTVANTASLASDSISVLYEDRSTNLWIGTDDAGLMCYRDGQFTRFGAEQGLAEAEVFEICEARDGTLWVGTRRGLFFLKNERFHGLPANAVLAQGALESLVAAPNGGLWIGTSKGLFRLSLDATELTTVLSVRDVQSLAVDTNQVVWAMVDSRTNYRISPRGSEIDTERRPLRYSSFRQGRAGALWLASNRGVLFHSRGGDISNATAVVDFERPHISSIYEDIDGDTWVGLESHGLYRLRRKRVTILGTGDGILTENVTTILEDAAGKVWLGTFGNGLLVANDERSPFERRPVASVANITGLHETRQGALWFGTFNAERYCWNDTRFVPDPSGAPGCRAICEDREGALWIGTLRNGVERHQGGQVQRFTTKEGLSNERVQCLTPDFRGDLWVGTLRGLNRISGGKVTPFAGDETLRKLSIRVLYTDRRGELWIGSWGGGLMRQREERLQQITSRHGLPSDSIESILEDEEGRFWLGTADGIVCISRDELEACADGRKSLVNCMTLGPEDGMGLARCGTGFQPSSMKSRSGALWFCTASGVVVVEPKTIRPRLQAPPVYIEEVTADDTPLPIQRSSGRARASVSIPPQTSRVGFRYTALSLGAPERLQFRYRLDGFDEEWVSARGEREGYYTRLPRGSYQFRVMATGQGGVSNETGATVAVLVVPAWWQTWWFHGAAILAVAGFVFGGYEWRVYQHRKARAAQEAFSRRLIDSQEQERKRVAAELHDSLGQSLQIIKGRAQLGLNRPGPPGERSTQLEEISAAATQAIHEVRAISQALRPAELDQLGLTRALDWMVQQAGATSPTRFACELDEIDGALSPEMEISLYRIAQEGINNVLRHAAAAEAILELKQTDGIVRFSLFDNGRGFARAAIADSTRARFGRGLAGIAERVKLMGGEFDLQSGPGRGTRLTVTCRSHRHV
jgi:signal transduction histidine kinase/ligand-binding sensor domain-containing protein